MEKESKNVSQKAFDQFKSMGLHGQELKVEEIKFLAAELWDCIDKITGEAATQEAVRHSKLAKTKLEESVMWAVKAVSRNA